VLTSIWLAQFTKVIGADEGTAEANDLLLTFLRKIDDDLQEFTLGISEREPQRPDRTSHTYRKLGNYTLGGGSGTGEFFLRLSHRVHQKNT
jgi:hypothetical protein